MEGFGYFGKSALIQERDKYHKWHIPKKLAEFLNIASREEAEIYVNQQTREIMLKLKKAEA